jgi:transglutaminase superfamily protein
MIGRDVSRWLTELSDSQAGIDDALATKPRQLTANAKTELDRIKAIGRYAQSVNYVAIQTGIGRGGGYRPHSSIDVFAKSYGDCKDKANLMRAMLKAIGIQSYLVSIYSGDPTFVREEWPSPQQFNHCIIAVKLADATQAATVINHPSLGRLLIFDPTDDNTPVGEIYQVTSREALR